MTHAHSPEALSFSPTHLRSLGADPISYGGDMILSHHASLLPTDSPLLPVCCMDLHSSTGSPVAARI